MTVSKNTDKKRFKRGLYNVKKTRNLYEDIELFGTDGDEQLVGFEAILKAMKTQFDELESILINISDQNIKINKAGNTAWFSQILNYNFIYQDENMSFEGIRFTGVLEKRDGKWVLVQGHLSVPYDADLE